ncbi:MAG: immunity 53 family protein [Thermoleophilia bacterium]
MSVLKKLEKWFFSECNGDWEHTYGIKITTLDNPGWMIVIDLKETELFEKMHEEKRVERSEHDWIHLKIEHGKYKSYGGPENLEEMIKLFLEWAEKT